MNSTTIYHQLLSDVLKNGVHQPDRTGTGRRSVFGRQVRFDLSKEFPLLTTKKVNFEAIKHELLWFLKGSTNIKYLHDHNIHIWDAWTDENGNLGPIYGHQLRNFGGKPTNAYKPNPTLDSKYAKTYLGVANGHGKQNHILAKTWEGMIARCYDPNSIEYKRYGAIGVHVCNRWLAFENFAEDASKLPGWNSKLRDHKAFVLDKDGIGNGFIYGPEYCQWITHQENVLLTNPYIYVVKKDNVEYTFSSPTQFCREQEIDDRNFSDLWTSRKNAKQRYGYELVSIKDTSKGIDQIATVIDSLKNNPESRRHVLTLWNPTDRPLQALDCCHGTAIQFYSEPDKDGGRRLSCQLYQRSADIFLGVSYNIASYALLTHMIAQVTGHQVGEFIHTFGDLHLYDNHIMQANLQLSRDPEKYRCPQIELDNEITNIDHFKGDHIKLIGYQSYPFIKAPIAV